MDNGTTWITATAAGTSWSIGTVTLTGSNTMLVRVQDAAGNIGSAASYAYVLDTTAPTTTFSNVAFSNDTGISNTDLITNNSVQTISATLSAALASGDHMLGSLDGGVTWTDITAKVSGTTLSWNGVTLASSNSLQLRTVDAAGNYGSISSYNYTLDTTAPISHVTGISFSNDSGMSNGDFITNIAAQTVSGTLSANVAAGETVYVSLDNGATWHAATAAVGQANWSISGLTLVHSDTLKVKVSDAAGNDGPVLSQGYTFDTTPTAAPGVDPLNTMSLTPTLTGSANVGAGDSLVVTVGGATYSVVPIAGTWTLDLSTATPDSGTLALVMNHRYDVNARITDVAGNVSNSAGQGQLLIGTIPVVVANDAPPLPPPLPSQTQLPQFAQPAPVPAPELGAVGDRAGMTPTAPAGRTAVPGAPQSEAWTAPPGLTQLLQDITRADNRPSTLSTRADLLGNDGVLVTNVPQPDLNIDSGSRISFVLPGDAFAFSGSRADMLLSMTLADGRPLPAWLRFDSRSGKVDGTPPPGFAGVLELSVTARDAQGHVAVQAFKIIVGKRTPSEQRTEMQPLGRPGLADQLRLARTGQDGRMAALADVRRLVRTA